MRKSEIYIYRMIRFYKKRHLKIANLISIFLRLIFSLDIKPTIEIGKNVEFVHNGLGVVIHAKAKIMDNCKIYQNVTLGGNGKLIDGVLTNTGGPTLLDNVTVFSGACVLGPITIGENSIIGANAVVLDNIPPNSLAVGIPAIIKPLKSNYNYKTSELNK